MSNVINSDEEKIIKWLLEGDVSIQFQVYRDLLGTNRKELHDKIETQGWGFQFLSKRKPDLHWGERFYQPKWISTHYTLLDLRNLNLKEDNKIVQETINAVLDSAKSDDGGIKLGPSTSQRSDVCVNGMFLNYASYFEIETDKLHSVVDSVLNEIMPDGGFNCRTVRSGAKHSSLHTTISVLEGLFEFQKRRSSYRAEDIKIARDRAEEFILLHQLYRSDRTGVIIHKDFIQFPYPCRWKYDILRALDYFQYSGKKYDERMKKAIDVLLSKKSQKGMWKLNAAYPGQVHIKMEAAGKPSRWNTLRAMRVLKHFEVE